MLSYVALVLLDIKSMNQSSRTNELPLRVLLVDETFERAALLKHALQEAGYQIAAHVTSSADLPGLVSELKPDVIIISSDSPDRDTLEHLCVISRDQPRPIVMFTHDDDSEKIRVAIQAGVSAYVVDGLKSERLRPIMDVAMARFKEFQSMRRELEKAEEQLAGRKDVDRAKGILMKQRGWSEEEAYQALRKMAMDKGMKLADAARQVIAVFELLG
jgi:two-component system, response regulator / RNA-binding antiterminator